MKIPRVIGESLRLKIELMLENWNCQGFVNLQRNEVERKIENYLREIRWNGVINFIKGAFDCRNELLFERRGSREGTKRRKSMLSAQ